MYLDLYIYMGFTIYEHIIMFVPSTVLYYV